MKEEKKMKRARKGFTLVELLIVIAILGALSATMMVAVKGSTSKAKAVAIAANVEACKTAVEMYLGDNEEMDGATTGEIDTILTTYIGTWADFNRDKTTYTASGSSPSEWKLTVDFHDEPDKDAIITALKKIKGFGDYGKKIGGTGSDKDDPAVVVRTGNFSVDLLTGEVTSEAVS